MKNGRAAGEKIHQLRKQHDVRPVFKRVDTCAAEFESYTPYLYSTYEEEDEATPPIARRSSFWAAGPTASGRALSSTTAAATPRSRCAMTVSKRS